MADEFEVVISDKVAPTIKVKLDQLGRAADSAQDRLDRLMAAQDRLSSTMKIASNNIEQARARLSRLLASDRASTNQLMSVQSQLTNAQLRYNQMLTNRERLENQISRQRQAALAAEIRYKDSVFNANSRAIEQESAMKQKEQERLANNAKLQDEVNRKLEERARLMANVEASSKRANERFNAENQRIRSEASNQPSFQRLDISGKIPIDARQKIESLADSAEKAHNRVLALQGAQEKLSTSLQQSAVRLDTARARLDGLMRSSTATEAQLRGAQSAVIQAQLRYNQATANSIRGQGLYQRAVIASESALRRYHNAINTANGGIRQHTQLMDQLGLSYSRGGLGLIRWVQGVAAAAGLTFGARAIVEYANAYQTLENRLKVVSTSQSNLNYIMREVESAANRARAPIDDFGRSYARFDRALAPIGKTQEESIRMTETVAKSLALSGATAGETSAALLQLSQAFSAGRLMGDEFRSVSELMPVALKAIADELGVTTGQLKELSSSGAITTEVMFKAFARIGDEVDAQFERMNVTADQGMSRLQNSLTVAFKDTGISSFIGETLIALSDNLDVAGASVVTFGLYFSAVFAVSKWTAINTAVTSLWATLAAHPLIAVSAALAGIGTYLYAARNEIELTADGSITLGSVFSGTGDIISEIWNNMLGSAEDYYDGVNDAADNANSKIVNQHESLSNDFKNKLVEMDRSLGSYLQGASDSFLSFIAGSANNAQTIVIDANGNMTTQMLDNNGRIIGSFANLADAIKTGFEASFNFIVTLFSRLPAYINDLLTSGANAAIRTYNSMVPKRYQFKEIRENRNQTDPFGDALNAAHNTKNSTTFKDTFDGISRDFDYLLDKFRTKSQEDQFEKRPPLPASPSGYGGKGKGRGGNRETREEMLARINRELEKEYANSLLLEDVRERQTRYDKIEEEFLKKKFVLHANESAVIKEKIDRNIKSNEVTERADAIYRKFRDPHKEYLLTLDATSELLQKGNITQEEYTQAVKQAQYEYDKITDKLFDFNLEINNQISLSGKIGVAYKAEARVIAERNRLLSEGKTLLDTEAQAIRNKVTQIEQLARRQQAINSLEAMRNPDASTKDMIDVYSSRKTHFEASGNDAAVRMQLASQYLGSNAKYLENTSSSLEAELESRRSFYSKLQDLRAADILKDQDIHQIKLKLIEEEAKKREEASRQQFAAASDFYGNMSSLMRVKNKEMFAIGKAAAIAKAGVDMYASANAAYNAMAGIPVVGPGLATIAASGAIAAGMVNIASIQSQEMPGFRSGGYTGNMPTNDVAGVVHGREYVFDAASTARIGRENLDAMRRGDSSPGYNSPPTVNVNVAIVGTEAEARQWLESSDGEQVIVDVVAKNAKRLNPILKSA